ADDALSRGGRSARGSRRRAREGAADRVPHRRRDARAGRTQAHQLRVRGRRRGDQALARRRGCGARRGHRARDSIRRRGRRPPALAIPFLVIPLAIYLLFGVLIIGDSAAESEWGPGIANFLFSGFAAVGAMMPGIFSGTLLAQERDAALLKLKRALPMPPGAYLIAKTAMSMGLAAIAVTVVVVAALAAGKVTISVTPVLV